MNRISSPEKTNQARHYHLLASILALSVFSACATSQPEPREGVIMAQGDTVVEMGAYQPGAMSSEPRRAATFSDVVEVTADIACTHPDGISDIARRAAISKEMDSRKIDQASFDAELSKAAEEMAFMEALAETMEKKCPAALLKMLEGAEAPPAEVAAPDSPKGK